MNQDTFFPSGDLHSIILRILSDGAVNMNSAGTEGGGEK